MIGRVWQRCDRRTLSLYRMHIATTEDNTKETLFRTTRGFFLQKGSSPAIEISVTQAQAFYDAYGININTGW